jgi:hypothetical protein
VRNVVAVGFGNKNGSGREVRSGGVCASASRVPPSQLRYSSEGMAYTFHPSFICATLRFMPPHRAAHLHSSTSRLHVSTF